MASLADRLKKNSTVKDIDSIVHRKCAPTKSLPLNIALQGRVWGGVSPGITMFAGPSRHFKTNLALICAAAWLDEYPEAILLFYDSEFGAKRSYFESVGIDYDNRVVHSLIKNVEELKFDMYKQLESLAKDGTDNVIILIDSVGNLASKREVDNADNQNSAADMTRAKELKSLWRIVTPYFESLGIPCLVVNHTYNCGTGDMQVSTPTGPKKLESLSVGDVVNTKEGPQEVQYTTKQEKAIVYDIELEDGTILSFTEGHKFVVNGEWKYLHDLKEGDILETV